MYLQLVFLICASSPVLTSVWKTENNDCSSFEFKCDNGDCVSLSAICDGQNNCLDNSDEAVCSGKSDTLRDISIIGRSKRQTACRKSQWKCRDGTCIAIDGKCDGIVDCPDGSDETHALCRKTYCQSNWFRCTYGACVDGTAPCNNVSECADNSDELLPRCRNENDEVKGTFTCQNGQTIPAANHCDGVPDCSDGSDETVRTCAAKTCYSYLFQCAYGACVDQGADCNGVKECADGSDESDELCNRMGPITPTRPTPPPPKPQPQPNPDGKCQLPAYPPHGRYQVMNAPNASPYQISDLWVINVTCDPGYGLLNEDPRRYCAAGVWSPSEKLPECMPYCKLNRHPSVEHRCRITISGSQGTRPCNDYEPPGTLAFPECVKPNYFHIDELPTMQCTAGGMWSDNPTCSLACGQVSPEGVVLISGGRRAKKAELPWHVGIYRKTSTPYKQICGGSIVRPSVVISAAHCFWAVESVLPASTYAVAAGKLYRPWDDPVDNPDAQKSDVESLHIPNRFKGASSNFMEDIAVVLLVTAFEYKPHIAPVCLSFEEQFDLLQVSKGKIGKVAGWGVTSVNGAASPFLKVVDLPIVPYDECYDQSPPNFRAYISGDKICAGYRDNGTAVCKGDSGGGLAIAEDDRGKPRYYLRGIVSTAPDDENLCAANTITTFTHIIKHATFIKNYL